MADYFFREDLEAEKDRQAQNGPISLNPAPAAVQTMAAPKPAAQGNPYAAIGKAAAPTNPFDSFRASLEAQDPFKAQAKAAITDTLANPAAAADEAAGLSRDRLQKSQQVEEERRRQAATTAYGGAQTGQVGRAMDDFSAEKTLQTQDHEGQLRAERLAAIERNRSSAIGQATTLLGQDESAKLAREGMDLTRSEGALERASREGVAFAGLNLEEKRLAQEGMQFQSKQDFDRWALQKGLDNETAGRVWQSVESEKARTSQEKIAFAGLSLQERELAQQAMQFASKLDFDKSALAAQMDEASRARIWQAVENEKSRTSTEKIAFAGLNLQERELAQQAMQFGSRLDFDKSSLAAQMDEAQRQRIWQAVESEKARASTEGIAFAQLSQQDRALAQEAMIAGNRLAWDQKALQMGLDDRAADRIWQAAEGEKARLSQEKLAYAQIGSQEKLQASAQTFEAAQAELNRTLEQMLSNDRIGAQFQLADLDRQLQERMQSAGFVQESTIEGMRQQLQLTLQERGIDADTATQIADQKFTEMMAFRDQAFQTQMNDIKQSFISGERREAQEWEAVLQSGEMHHEELMTRLSSTLRLNEADNAQKFQTSFQTMQNDFTKLRDEMGYSHEDAMRAASETFQTNMQAAGFAQEDWMQERQMAVQLLESDRNRASQEMMAAAQLAQSDSHFMEEIAQRYNFNIQDLQIRQQELAGNLKLMGLQGQQLTAALADGKISSAMQIAALGMEIGDGSADSMAPFVEALGTSLEAYFKAQGIDITKSEFMAGLTKETAAPGSTTGPAPGTMGAVDSAKDYIASIRSDLSASVNITNVANILNAAGSSTSLTSSTGPNLVAYGAAAPAPPTKMDYNSFLQLKSAGLTDRQAYEALSRVIGVERFKAAYKASTGKDWA